MYFVIYAESEKEVIPGKTRQSHAICKAKRMTRPLQEEMIVEVIDQYLNMFPPNRPLGAFRISGIFAMSNAKWAEDHQPQQKDGK